MRYELDINGYVLNVYWGCNSGNCQEYTGEVPAGYSSLVDWSEKALINAYYINSEGNLTLDYDRKTELEAKIIQEEIDNTPLYHKDVFGSNAILDSQYQKQTATGTVLKLENVKSIYPRVKITDIDSSLYSNIGLYAHSSNMLKNDGKTESIYGIDFTKNADRSILLNGYAAVDIEYNLSGSSTNTTPIFVLKKDETYFFDIGSLNYKGCECEMNYFDGETVSQVYSGPVQEISISETKKVTQVILKIPMGTEINNTVIYPMLTYGTVDSETGIEYESYKCKVLDIDFSKYSSETIDYILIEEGIIYVSINGVENVLCAGNVPLLNGNNIFYADNEVNIEMEYSIDVLDVELYNGTMRIDKQGMHFYEKTGTEIGDIGIIENEDQKQVAFAINGMDGARAMVWGVKYNGKFIPVFFYEGHTNDIGTEAGGLFCLEAPIIHQENRIYLGQDTDGPSILGLGSAEDSSVTIDNANYYYVYDKYGNLIFSADADNFELCDKIKAYMNILDGTYYIDFLGNTLINMANVAESEDIEHFDTYVGDYSSLYVGLRDGTGFSLWTDTSDKKHKKDIENSVVKALDIIKQINHRQFNWKQSNKHVDIGYIAQELEKIDPNLVNKREIKDKEGNITDYEYQVNNLQVLAYCTKAIQEQQETIDYQRKQIDFLMSKLNCKEEFEKYMKGEN